MRPKAPFDYRVFDRVVEPLFAARDNVRLIGAFLEALARLFDGHAALTVFDGAGRTPLVSLSAPTGGQGGTYKLPPQLLQAGFTDLFASLFESRLTQPRRLSEFAERERWLADPWFKAICLDTGIMHALMQDLDRDGRRARLVVFRPPDLQDFDDGDIELFRRVCRHVSVLLHHADLSGLVVAPPPGLLTIRFGVASSRGGSSRLACQLADSYALTPAEIRIALLLATARTPAGCADALGVKLNTIRSHIKRIHRKMQISSLGQLIVTVSNASGWLEFAQARSQGDPAGQLGEHPGRR